MSAKSILSLRSTASILAVGALTVMSAAQADVMVTAKSVGVADSPKNRAIAQCVRAIHEYWPKKAQLMLPNKGRMQSDNGLRLITINGAVWQQGQRQTMSHECRSTVRGSRFALSVAPTPSATTQQIAAQFQ